MSIKKILFTPLFLFCLLLANGQQIEIRPAIAIGTYSMSDLKGLLKQSVSRSVVALKTTENFPKYVFYGLDVIQSVTSKFGLGISTGFYSTGGRNHYADYSGSYREEIQVNSVNMGLLASYRDSLVNNFFYNMEVASGIKLSNISIEDELKLSDFEEGSTHDFRSTGWWIEPQIRVGRHFFGNFSCAAFVRYEFNLKSKIISKENNEIYLTGKIDWSGIRTGISASYTLQYR